MRMLLADDDKKIAFFLKNAFKQSGFVIDIALTGNDAMFRARTNNYDVAILDLEMPGNNGDEICKKIREEGKEYPVIILSVNSNLKDKVKLLSLGADDYLTKPFSFEELLARVNVVLRRPHKVESKIYEFEELEMDVLRRIVRHKGKKIRLTKKEFSILEFFFRNINNVVSKSLIIENVWDINADPFSNAIETHIGNLRRKIDNGKEKRYIHTEQGIGYRFGFK